MRGNYDEPPLSCLCCKGIGQSQALSRVLMGKRFVKQQGICITRQSERNPSPLSFSTGQSGPTPVGKFRQSHGKKRGIHPCAE
jgi:hypothetical protein